MLCLAFNLLFAPAPLISCVAYEYTYAKQLIKASYSCNDTWIYLSDDYRERDVFKSKEDAMANAVLYPVAVLNYSGTATRESDIESNWISDQNLYISLLYRKNRLVNVVFVNKSTSKQDEGFYPVGVYEDYDTKFKAVKWLIKNISASFTARIKQRGATLSEAIFTAGIINQNVFKKTIRERVILRDCLICGAFSV